MKTGYMATGVVLLTALSAFGATEMTTDTLKVESSTIRNDASGKTEASTVNYISSEQIDEINPKNIQELLKTVPGMTSDFMGNEVVEIHMRGMNQQEFMWEDTGVAIIVDGVPVYAKSGKFRLNLSDITSVKVIKGSAGYLYGNNATAGAIVITTSKPRGGDDAYSISAERGSYGAEDYEAIARISRENFAASLNANYRATDGYWIDSAFWSKSVSGKFSYYLDDTSDLTLAIDKTKKYEQQKRASSVGVTEANAHPEGSEASSFQRDNDVDLDKYILTYAKEFDFGGNLLVNAYRYVDDYDYISSPQDTNDDNVTDTYSKHSLQHKRQQGVKIEFKQELREMAYLVGYEYGRREYESSTETLIDYSSLDDDDNLVYSYDGETTGTEDKQRLHAVYTEFKYALSPELTGVFNYRHDTQKDIYDVVYKEYDGTQWEHSTESNEAMYQEDAYRVGATYAYDPKTTLYANISTGYRTPTVNKIVTNYENRSRTDDIPVDIDVQRTVTYEIGARGNGVVADNRFGYELSLFQMDTSDIIGYRYGTYSMSTSGGITDNIGDARNQGLELSLETDTSKPLSMNIAYAYLKSEYTKHDPVRISRSGPWYDLVGNQLPRTPNHILDLYGTYRVSPDWKVIGEFYSQSNYYADETNKIEMPGYSTVNLQTRYTAHWGGNELEFYAKVNNIFDIHYYQTVYFTGDKNGDGTLDDEDPTITVAPGREYFVGMIYRF